MAWLTQNVAKVAEYVIDGFYLKEELKPSKHSHAGDASKAADIQTAR